MIGARYRFAATTESTLDELLQGDDSHAGYSIPLDATLRVPNGEFGLISLATDAYGQEPSRPVAIVVPDGELRKLVGRYAQLRADLSPLSSWCHLVSTSQAEFIIGLEKYPQFEGAQAAWAALVIAEAAALGERPVSGLKLATCLATQSFALARSHALWPEVPQESVLQRLDQANALFRSDSNATRSTARTARLRAALKPVWLTLESAHSGRPKKRLDEIDALAEAVSRLKKFRARGEPEDAATVLAPLETRLSEVRNLRYLREATPEARLEIFDSLTRAYSGLKPTDSDGGRRSILAFLIGYLSTIAAGGSPSLGLVERHSEQWPELMAWAYVLGSVGERVTWTSAFEGIGRLVSRELGRAFRFGDAPTCDIALDEAMFLVDQQLSDPLVHLRIKQARMVSVALLPGVNTTIRLAAETEPRLDGLQGRGDTISSTRESGVIPTLADALWPHLKQRVVELFRSTPASQGTHGTKELGTKKTARRKPQPSELPFRGSKR